jgi:hypothetical protein
LIIIIIIIIVIIIYTRWCVGQQQFSSIPANTGPGLLMIFRSAAWLSSRSQPSFYMMLLGIFTKDMSYPSP